MFGYFKIFCPYPVNNKEDVSNKLEFIQVVTKAYVSGELELARC
jgi:hypothetical protein